MYGRKLTNTYPPPSPTSPLYRTGQYGIEARYNIAVQYKGGGGGRGCEGPAFAL